MFRCHFAFPKCVVWVLAATSVAVLNCITAPSSFGDEPNGADAPANQKQGAGRYAVPDGGVDELLKFIDTVRNFQPESVPQFLKHRKRAPIAIRKAAAKIVAIEKDKSSAAYQKAQGYLLEFEVRQLDQQSPKQQKKTVENLLAYLSGKKLAARDTQLVLSAADGLGGLDDQQFAADACRRLSKLLAGANNEQAARIGRLLEGVARRISLVGNTMELTGTTLKGEPFDIRSLRGKLVLVDFWATWCGPCRREFPNVKRLYEKYHSQGFDVVGVSLDEDREALERYVQKNQVPWATLHEKDAHGRHPAAAYYGVFVIPTMILVGRDGKVVSLEARGETLEKLLAEKIRATRAPAP